MDFRKRGRWVTKIHGLGPMWTSKSKCHELQYSLRFNTNSSQMAICSALDLITDHWLNAEVSPHSYHNSQPCKINRGA